MQVTIAYGILVDKDVIRRVLNKHFKDIPGNKRPSWITFIGHMRDSLWLVDLFRTESIHLKTHWVMLIMDQFTRRIIDFSVHQGDVIGTVRRELLDPILFWYANDLQNKLGSLQYYYNEESAHGGIDGVAPLDK